MLMLNQMTFKTAFCRLETREQRKLFRLKACWDFIGIFGHDICIYAVIVTWAIKGRELKAESLYMMLGLFGHVRRSVLNNMTAAYRNILQGSVSRGRVKVAFF